METAGMPGYVVTAEAVDQIADVVKPHFKAMEADLAKEYPDRPEWAFVLGVALGMSVLLDNIEDPAERASAVHGINILVRHSGYALRPVT
jgi:hypothetical protein